jgi:IMP dehydrogenase
MIGEEIPLALTFDDVLIRPARSSVLPKETDVRTQLTEAIALNIPLVSAAMDTVTQSRTAATMAQEGGIGFIHKNLSIEDQAREVSIVKKTVTGMINDPITMAPERSVRDALDVMRRYRISGVPVTRGAKLVGILTNRDLRFHKGLDNPISQVMTSENLVTVPMGTTLDQAKDILGEHKIEKLLVVDDSGNLQGLITVKDIEKTERFPNSCKDERGRLRVGAAVGVGGDRDERIDALVAAGVDVICVDTAHGHSEMVIQAVREVRSTFPDAQVVAGNIATGEAAEALIEAGAHAVKVGIGPGSICTTRIVAGVGVPQVTAIRDVVEVAHRRGVKVIADGGIKFSGDVAKAVAAGGDSVMIGSLFAGTDESPGEVVLYQGRQYKVYRGMGSVEAMRDGSSDRYFQEDEGPSKLVPEGIVGRVPYRGPLSESIYQLVGGLRASMGYAGCADLGIFQQQAEFTRITNAGLRESHVHDVIIVKEAPNYRVE